MKKFQEIIKLNSAEQNEQIAWYCIEHSEIGRLKQLLCDGMPLDAFMLTAMVFFGYKDALIKEILAKSPIFNDNVIQWVRSYFEVDELAEILPRYQEKLPKDWPSNEGCVRLRLWTTLCLRKEFDAVARNAPELLLTNKETAYCSDAWVALLRVDFDKYAPQALKNDVYSAFLAHDDWWKYLVDNGKADWLLKLGDLYGLLPKEKIAEYCLQQGELDVLYDNKYDDILLKHKKFEVYIKHHSVRKAFLEQYPEQVDWEDLWQRASYKELRSYLLKQAYQHRNVPQCHEFLLAHCSLWKQILLWAE